MDYKGCQATVRRGGGGSACTLPAAVPVLSASPGLSAHQSSAPTSGPSLERCFSCSSIAIHTQTGPHVPSQGCLEQAINGAPSTWQLLPRVGKKLPTHLIPPLANQAFTPPLQRAKPFAFCPISELWTAGKLPCAPAAADVWGNSFSTEEQILFLLHPCMICAF